MIDTTEEVVEDEVEEEEEIEEPIVSKLPKSKKKEIKEEEIFDIEPKPQAPVKLTKKGLPRKKRAPLTEEHKAKLAKAREKAIAARKTKAEELSYQEEDNVSCIRRIL